MFTLRRAVVGACAIALIIIAIVGFARAASVGAGTVRYIANALIIAVSLYGLYGVAYLNHKHIKVFTFFLALIWLYLIANMVVNIVQLNVMDAIEDILLAGVTFICLVFAAALTHATKDLMQHDKALVAGTVGGHQLARPTGMAAV